MNRLEYIIQNKIRKSGPLSISHYMEICLFHNRYGYYMKKNPIGKKGDFTTSPEISQVFGELIGVWMIHTWSTMGEPKCFNILELGPGRGTLMKDIWRSTKFCPKFQKAANILLYDRSRVLIEDQEVNLEGVSVKWLKSLKSIPKNPTISIANEFFDALPINQFLFKNNTWFEKKVALNKNGGIGFDFFKTDQVELLKDPLVEKKDVFFERSELQIETIKYLSENLRKQIGCLLIIDYGGEYGQADTLQGMYQNKYCHFLERPGDIDLTSHVDFGILSDNAKYFGANPSKIVTQRHFLKKMGVFERFEKLMQFLPENRRLTQKLALNKLVAEDQMGTLFKVLAIKSKDAPNIYPFSFDHG